MIIGDGRYEIRVVVIEIRDDGTCGNVFTDWNDFKRECPNSGYEFGYAVFDLKTNRVPEVCSDWNSSVEEAVADYEESEDYLF